MDTHQSPATSDKRKRNLYVHLVENDSILTNEEAQKAAKKSRKQETEPLKTGHVHQLQNDSMLTSEEAQSAAKKSRKQETDPLKIGHILEKVFSFLDAESVKAARQVDPLWNVEGAKVLITKCYIKIPSAIRVGEDASKFKGMDEFKAFLSHKSIDLSTIPNITVDEVADVEMWKNLGVGQQVTSLKINSIPKENEDEFFFNLLDLLPSLKYLEMKELYYEPKLIKVLTSVMSTVKKDRNSLIISSLDLRPTYLKDLERFADCKNIMLEKLEFQFDEHLQRDPNVVTRVSNMLGKLLSTSQNILEKLYLRYCHPVLPLLEFPCMTALTEIELNSYSIPRFTNCKFSPTFRFSEKVPNLQYIRVGGIHRKECLEYWERDTNLFGAAGPAPSVKRVTYLENFSGFDIYHAFKTFPNLQSFETNVSEDSLVMLRCLWKHGRNLKVLRLNVEWYSRLLKKVGDIDASITGLPVGTVNQIKRAPNLDPYTLEELEELRVDTSILNLKELEHIQLCFYVSDQRYPDRMLAVSGKWAFSFLPKNPRIDIYVRNRDGMEFRKAFDDISKLPNVFLWDLDAARLRERY